MPLIETRGAASAQGFGEFAQSGPVNYIEDVFSTYLYTGNGSTQTITNGIDLSGKGGLVWLKERQPNGFPHRLQDSARGVQYFLDSASTAAEAIGSPQIVSSFNSNGFSLNANNLVNGNGNTEVSWTFRKQAKFFDVVTFTANGSGGGTFNHSLGSAPGCVILKPTSAASSWLVYHRSTGVSKYLELQSQAAEQTGTNWISVSSTSVTVDSGWLGNNRSVVAYLFAHDAGGFGLTGSDNVISCGSYTGTGAAGNPITLGYEPQYLLIKPSSMSGSWWVMDNMRPGALRPDSSAAESTSIGSPTLTVQPTATGFSFVGATLNDSSQTFIYIAIRRGPMKVPTSGTSVYYGETYTGNATARSFTAPGFPPDLFVSGSRSAVADGSIWGDRLRGVNSTLYSAYTQAESTLANVITNFGQNGASIGTDSSINGNTNTYVGWNFRRAPGFFDVVCYAGTGSNLTVSHNLTVAPQLIIIKNRTNAWSWNVGYNFGVSSYDFLTLDNNDPGTNNSYNSHYTAAPTTTQFFLATNVRVNQSSANFVAYLFATLAGVSKVGTYTGTGTTKQIDCGFTGGARFVLIKRTDNIGDWYVWDTARGIVSGNDPYLLLNSTAAEVTNTDYVDTYSAGFELSSTAPAALNANGGSFIFFAVA